MAKPNSRETFDSNTSLERNDFRNAQSQQSTWIRVLIPTLDVPMGTAMPVTPPTRADRPPIRLLLVEDDPTHASDIGRVLRSSTEVSFKISQAVRVEDALRMLRDSHYDVVLLDLSLEEGDGLDTLARAKVAARELPIIVMTNEADEAQAVGALRAGAQDYLVKGEWNVRLVIRTLLHAVERHRILTDLAMARQREHFVATHDSLTGLFNRNAFREQVARSMAYAARNDDRMALLFLDIDGFKAINDTLGHPIGDELLKITSERLRQVVRKSDMVARLGGDEFIVILQPYDEDGDPARVAQKILHCISRPCSLSGSEYRVTGSIGIALFPRDGLDPDVLIRNADTAMYHAKAEGRNRYSYYSQEMNEAVADSLNMENGLRQAIDRGLLTVHYQPQVHVGFGAIVGAEALVRWPDPQRGMISPSDFIPMAEATGLIQPLGCLVLREACEEAARWNSDSNSSIRIGVNVSTRQLTDSSFADLVATTLRETGLPPERLELEITESSVLQERGVTLATVQQLRSLGVKITIDDFGTGYSALSALRQLPVDGLKIDRSFVTDLASDASVSTITAGLIAMANGLGLETVAEGVETIEQLTILQSQGCQRMQGYLFAKPICADEFREQLNCPNLPWQQMLPEFDA